MKKAISVLLIVGWCSSLFCFTEPLVEYYMNKEYIATHLCESVNNPDIEDCDGFCYLIKQIKGHGAGHHGHGDHSSATHVERTLPFFLYYEPLSTVAAAPAPRLSYEMILKIDQPERLAADVQSPPPRVGA